MIEALIAFVLAILIIAVFNAPAWAIRIGSYGGLGFVLYVLILVIEWLIEKFNKKA